MKVRPLFHPGQQHGGTTLLPTKIINITIKKGRSWFPGLFVSSAEDSAALKRTNGVHLDAPMIQVSTCRLG